MDYELIKLCCAALSGGGITTIATVIINKFRNKTQKVADLTALFEKAAQMNEKTLDTYRQYTTEVISELRKDNAEKQRDKYEMGEVIGEALDCEAVKANPKQKCPVNEANRKRLKAKCQNCNKKQEETQ